MTLKTIAYIALFAFNINFIHAQEIVDYQVEVLLFKQMIQDKTDTELFEDTLIIPNTELTYPIPKFDFEKISKESLDIFEAPETIEEALLTDTEENLVIKQADKNLLLLNDIKGNLKRSSQYNIITHTAWQQQGLDNDNAKKIHVTHGNAFVIVKDKNNDEIKNTAIDFDYLLEKWQAYNTLLAEEDIQLENKVIEQVTEVEKINGDSAIEEELIEELPEDLIEYFNAAGKSLHISHPLDGTIKIVRTRYLHMYTDLIWTLLVETDDEKEETIIETPPQLTDAEIELQHEYDALSDDEKDQLGILDFTEPEEGEVSDVDSFISQLDFVHLHSYSFKEHRKMRSKRKHFIDHPKLGLLTIITPLLKKTEVEKENSLN